MDKVAIKESEQPQESQISMAISPPLPSIFNIKLVKNSHVHRFWFARRPAYIDFGQKNIRAHRFQSNPYSNTIDLRGAPSQGPSIFVENSFRSIDLRGAPSQGPSIFVENGFRVHRFEGCPIPRSIDFCGKRF